MWTLIDIGSNSIRAMEAEQDGVFGEKRLFTTRLALRLDESGLLDEDRMEASLAVLADICAEARRKGRLVRAYATSAVRDAKNRALFLARIRERCALEVDVLSGADEARYALLGAGGDALVDIGGGSTQIVAGDFARSWPIGCVRAAALKSRDAIEARCRALFDFPSYTAARWSGVGGTLTTLAAFSLGLTRYERQSVNGTILSRDALLGLTRELERMGEARAAHPLLKERHDVVVPGARIALFIMRGMRIDALHISDGDGLEGYYLARCRGAASVP